MVACCWPGGRADTLRLPNESDQPARLVHLGKRRLFNQKMWSRLPATVIIRIHLAVFFVEPRAAPKDLDSCISQSGGGTDYRGATHRKENYTQAPGFCTEDPRSKSRNAIQSTLSFADDEWAQTSAAVSFTGDQATWEGNNIRRLRRATRTRPPMEVEVVPCWHCEPPIFGMDQRLALRRLCGRTRHNS